MAAIRTTSIAVDTVGDDIQARSGSVRLPRHTHARTPVDRAHCLHQLSVLDRQFVLLQTDTWTAVADRGRVIGASSLVLSTRRRLSRTMSSEMPRRWQ